MSDATLGPFRCPAHDCHNDEQGTSLGDAKRFYLHWFSTHKPRCPRTDCKYSLQDLSKTTESYFLRHWTTHFPELNPSKSACDKCRRQFANVNNRDRHAIKCMSGTSGGDQVVTEETGHEHDLNTILSAVGDTAPKNGPFDWSGLDHDQGPSGTLLLDEGMTFLNEFALSSVCMAEPSSMIAVAPPISTSYVAVSTMDLYSDYTMVEQTSPFSLPHDPFSLPVQRSRVIELEDELSNNFTGAKLDQMFDTNMLEVTTGANAIASSSRKRPCEGETTQRKKRHQTVVTDADHFDASFNFSDTHPGADNPEEIWLSPGISGSMSQGGGFPLELAAPAPHQSTSVSLQITDDCDYPLSRSTLSGSLPLRIRKQYTRKSWTVTVSKQQSRCVHRSTQLIAVKSFIQTAKGHQQVSYDHYTWVHKLIHGPRRTTDTTAILVNNVLVSKKTRFPRVIDDNAAIFQLCATGQYDEVNRLLTRGDASIVDVNSDGETLLHIAVSHLQVEICRLLLAKGADIDARDWQYSHTPLRSACHQGGRGRAKTVNFSCNDFINTVRLLIESGVDVCVSVEVDHSTFWLADSLNVYEHIVPMSEKLKIIDGLLWLFRKYMQATTCDGVLPTDVLHQWACTTISQSEIEEYYSDRWFLEGPDNHFLTRKDTLAFQSYWLFKLAMATEFREVCNKLSRDFCCTYAGDFHYRLPLELNGRTIETSPMELALGSFFALGSFHLILSATGIDVKDFTKVECTMPWCHHTQQTLDRIFSLDPEEYWGLQQRFPGESRCFGCHGPFQHYGVEDWEAIVGLVKSGRSLDSVLEFASEADEAIYLSTRKLCKSCSRHRYENNMSEDSCSDSEEDVSEWMGLVEVESEQGFRGDGRISTLDIDQFEDDGDADTSDEDPSDEISSDEISSDEEV